MKKLKQSSWLRRKFELWLMQKYMLRYGPAMIQRRGYWQYVDPYGHIYNVTPTGAYGEVPLAITRIE